MEVADIPMTQETLRVKITNESLISRVLFTLNSFHKASQPSLLCGNTEVVT